MSYLQEQLDNFVGELLANVRNSGELYLNGLTDTSEQKRRRYELDLAMQEFYERWEVLKSKFNSKDKPHRRKRHH